MCQTHLQEYQILSCRSGRLNNFRPQPSRSVAVMSDSKSQILSCTKVQTQQIPGRSWGLNNAILYLAKVFDPTSPDPTLHTWNSQECRILSCRKDRLNKYLANVGVNNYIVRSYRDVIVVANIVTWRTSKAY